MIKSNAILNSNNKSIKVFEKVRESVNGLYEILRINFSENDIYYQSGTENLIRFYRNLI